MTHSVLAPQQKSRAFDRLQGLIGRESHLEETVKALSHAVRELHPPVVGAMLATCSDESERECCDVFQRHFVQHFVPRLKFSNHGAFRTANLGSQYEWGSIRIAESHFATEASRGRYKLMVVKINSHVAVFKGLDGITTYGRLSRYHEDSPCCGALSQLIDGADHPFVRDLRTAFGSEAKDRLGTLRKQIDPSLQMLFAALINARLQARKATIDIQDYQPLSPTLYLILPCVTINRPERDSEILCGIYWADYRGSAAAVEYQGLGSEPHLYEVERELDRVRINDPGSARPRPARDHRRLLVEQVETKTLRRPQAALQKVQQARTQHPDLKPYAKILLKTMLLGLAEVSPIPAALLLFGEGLFDIHHIFKMERLSHGVDDDAKAKELLGQLIHQVDTLPPDRAQKVLDALLAHYQ